MIKLSDDCYVAEDQIIEVKVSPHLTHITVRTKDGVRHCHTPGYGESVYEALDKLIAEINKSNLV